MEIMIVVAIIGLLAAIAIPNFVRARNTAQKNTCINNLRQIDAAKEQAALEKRWTNGTVITDGSADASNVNMYIKGLANTTNEPTCPAGGLYTYGNIGSNPVCTVTGHAVPNP